MITISIDLLVYNLKVKKEWRRAIYKAKWLPICCRVNIGGYNGHLSSPPSSSSGPQNVS
jgi:hypothetical protein